MPKLYIFPYTAALVIITKVTTSKVTLRMQDAKRNNNKIVYLLICTNEETVYMHL